MSDNYRPPLEVPDHNDPCWKQWFELIQQYREEEPATSINGHNGAPDPHGQYQKESEKGAANGYASLDAGGTVPDTQIPATITRDTELATAISNLIAQFKRGEMYNFNTSTSVTIGSANTWITIGSGFTGGDNDGVTFQNSSELLIVTAGTYKVEWSLSLDASAANVEIEAGIEVNGTIAQNTVAHHFFGTANDTGVLASQGWLTLAQNDIVTLAVNNNTSATDVSMEHANVILSRWPE